MYLYYVTTFCKLLSSSVTFIARILYGYILIVFSINTKIKRIIIEGRTCAKKLTVLMYTKYTRVRHKVENFLLKSIVPVLLK